MRSWIEIYFDKNDVDLQVAANVGDHSEATAFIEKGSRNSTDIFYTVSEETRKSWLVLYEVSYRKEWVLNYILFFYEKWPIF